MRARCTIPGSGKNNQIIAGQQMYREPGVIMRELTPDENHYCWPTPERMTIISIQPERTINAAVYSMWLNST